MEKNATDFPLFFWEGGWFLQVQNQSNRLAREDEYTIWRVDILSFVFSVSR